MNECDKQKEINCLGDDEDYCSICNKAFKSGYERGKKEVLEELTEDIWNSFYAEQKQADYDFDRELHISYMDWLKFVFKEN